MKEVVKMADTLTLAPPGDFHQKEQEKRLARYREELFLVRDLGENLYEVVNQSHTPETRYLVQTKPSPDGKI